MVNAGDVFAGAAAGGPVGPMFDLLREVVEKSCEFNSILKSVKSTVDSLALLIPQIEDRNMILGGNRVAEVDQLDSLKKTMGGGVTLIKKLLDVNEWSCLKAHYTNQLVDLDESLKRHLDILQVQGVIDAKETLVVAKENTELAKITIRSVDKLDTTVKAGVADIQKDIQKGQDAFLAKLTEINPVDIWQRQFDVLTMRLKLMGRENEVGSLNEAAALGATLQELEDAVTKLKLEDSVRKLAAEWGFYHLDVYLKRIRKRTGAIFDLIEKKRTQNEEIMYIPTEVLHDFRVKIEEGVELVRNCSEFTEWTDDLKSEYSNKFLNLDKTLERLYNRLNGIHPFKWNTGKCGSSCGTSSTKNYVIIEDQSVKP